MCGISYIQNFSDKSKINKILNSMRDRGPDGKDYKILDNNFFGFPIWTFLIVTVLGGMFINSIYNELKFNKLEPNRKNLINH